MITIKSPREFAKMAMAGRCVAATLEAVREAAKPGVSMLELDAVAARVIHANGCVPSFLGYHGFPSSICTSPNDVVVHGVPGEYRLREGDIVSIDAGAIYEGYHGDAAFTMAIGAVPAAVTRLIEVTEKATWAGVAAARPGARVGDVGSAVATVGDGYGIVRQYVGHGIGRQMHEEPQVPNYGSPGKGVKFRTGMAICIEPMFNLGSHQTKVDLDGWTVRTADGSLSAHWEHTVCLTPDGVVVTTVREDSREGATLSAG